MIESIAVHVTYRLTLISIFVVLSGLWSAVQSSAQTHATLSGTVVDATGGALPGVTVTLTNEDTNLVRTAVTNAEGRYVLAALAPGAYSFLAALTGFTPYELKNLRLTIDMFDLLEYPNEGRLVVLNRSDSRVGLTAADIDRVLRVPIAGHVPSTRDVPVSINRGVPLMADSPDHPVSRSIRQVAEAHLGGRTVGMSEADTRQPSRRLFALRKGR